MILGEHNIVVKPIFRLPLIPHDDTDDLRYFHPLSPTAKSKDLYDNAINGCDDDSRKMLVYLGCACSNNVTLQARAGYGLKWSSQHSFSYRLEGTGPETSNRAELRAQWPHWG